MVDRIFGGEHEERLWERVSGVADGDLVLLHRFEQRTLHLCGSTVNLVGQHEIGEDGALTCVEGAILRAVDQGADDVGGQQVGCKLDALEIGVGRGGERADA